MVKWSNPEKGVAPSLHLGIVAIEKGAFGSPSTTVANFTFLLFLNSTTTRVAFALNNPWRLICHLNKETEPKPRNERN